MSAVIKPREVDRPFLGRWWRAAGSLFLRSPLRFGIVIALLGGLDTWISAFAEGLPVQKFWVDRIGLVLLPAVWLLVCALARGADDPGQTRSALAALAHRNLWIAVGTGLAVLLAIIIVVQGTAGGLSVLLGAPSAKPILWHSGQLVGSLTVNVMLYTVAFDPCYLPLLLFAGELSHSDARHLARRAAELNRRFLVWFCIAIVVSVADTLARSLPAYGMTASAFLVALGIFNYVAYRDIFERRPENLPRLAPARGLMRASAVPR